RSTSCWWSTSATGWSARSTCTTCSAPKSSEAGMPHPASDALERARRIRLMILDVDGVLTDGILWYGARGIEELKGFHWGDDLVDIPVLARCGFACAPGESPEEVRRRAHYVCAAPAGRGAVREVCEFLMRAQGTMDRVLQEYLK